MAVIVQKYGGTSVGSLARIEAVAENVIATVRQGHQVVVVLSAMSGETNRLVSLATQLDAQPSTRELDMLMASGEQVSISLLTIALIQRGFSAVSLLAHQVGIRTNNHFGRARIESIDTKRLEQALEQEQVIVVAGFQGVDNEANITTLGRGGSDTSAVAMAVAVQANECQIFTDVNGIYTSDPRLVEQARKIEVLTFEEALVMASLGAKVLQNRAVEYGLRHNMPIRVLSSFEPGEGSLVTHKDTIAAELCGNQGITSIAHHQHDILVIINGIESDIAMANLFTLIGEQGIELEMLNKSVLNAGQINLQFVIHSKDQTKLTNILQKFKKNYCIKDTQIHTNVAKVSAIGVGIKAYAGLVGEVLTTLAKEQIKVLLISTSELSISVVIDEVHLNTAISRLHQVFDLASLPK
ncbi:aspartate kinase [Thalassotalea atypica]|uniref:aspartate kinase n=1 Tax=Thalassotalea atypica TaxID=2054316 RepID=UPI002572DCBA|nr:aspartate kinase [Thalassotalea atypica]